MTDVSFTSFITTRPRLGRSGLPPRGSIPDNPIGLSRDVDDGRHRFAVTDPLRASPGTHVFRFREVPPSSVPAACCPPPNLLIVTSRRATARADAL